jgi:hypothetical protein
VKQPRKTVGVYETPRRAKWPRIVAAIFAVLVGIIVAIGFGSRFFGEARAGAMPQVGFVRTVAAAAFWPQNISSTRAPLWTYP